MAWSYWLRWGLIGGALTAAIVGLLVVGLFVYYAFDSNLPKIESVSDYKPDTVTRVLDRKGRIIGEIGTQRRTVVPLDVIPRMLIDAVVASEDAEFFQHQGIDYMGMIRAFFANLRAGRFVQGGSTITQQVVKTFFLSPERTIKRKMQEVILARRLEAYLDKNEILFLYLNQIYFGHGRYGVQEASRYYFDKDVSELTLGECALLAGLPQAPERLSPFKHPDRAKQRQMYVLRRMAELEKTSEAVVQQVADQPIRVVRQDRQYYQAAPEILDIVRNRLSEFYGDDEQRKTSTVVRTTIDGQLQHAARTAVLSGLRALDARHDYRKPTRHIKLPMRDRVRNDLARKQKTLRSGLVYDALVLGAGPDPETLECDLGADLLIVDVSGRRYNPQHDPMKERFNVGDLIRVRYLGKGAVFDPGPQAALVAMDVNSGDVLAMVGGHPFRAGGFNRALNAARQPGSAFKPFVYAAAIDSESMTAATLVEDSPIVLENWEPRNFDSGYRGPITLREAITHSINTVSAKVLQRVGVDRVITLARQMGISSPLGHHPSLALGSVEVKPIDMAVSYAVLANGGMRVAPHMITQIGPQRISVPKQERVLRPSVAYIVTTMLQDVVKNGTARRARGLRRPVAGKTGTTNDHKDAWFVGYSPEIVTVVWVGFDVPRSLGPKESGARAALPIWLDFMRAALSGHGRKPFHQPPDVVVKAIDPATGLLASAGADQYIDEYFVRGTEPQKEAASPDQLDPDAVLMDPGTP